MSKHDFLSPKAIANRMKAKGLQKLRWYCQLCNKQCRDENGFKCHLSTEGHNRLMLVFGEKPNRFIEGYSEIFETNFLKHLKISHPFSRVHANEFYQGVIKEKHHIHMNSTKWLTLTDFVKHLGRTGKCLVEETEKGWYITLDRCDLKNNKEQHEANKINIISSFEKSQIFSKSINSTKDYTCRDVVKTYFDYSLKAKNNMYTNTTFEEEPWLAKGIVVKFTSRDTEGNNNEKLKGLVTKIIERYAAEIVTLKNGDSLHMNQKYLSTVLPQLGSNVLILKGCLKGKEAKLIDIDSKRLRGKLRFGNSETWFEYDQFSKFVVESK
jgi:DNA/RNA-binding protein KIN17